MIRDYGRFKYFVMGMVIFVLVLSMIGMWQIRSTPYLGYQLSAYYKVVRVAPGSPAAIAGMKVGDQVIEINGIPAQKLYHLSQSQRTEIGGTEQMAISRGSVRHDLIMKASALPPKEEGILWYRNLVALAMMAVGCMLYWKGANKVSSLFLLFNLLAALSLMTPPYFWSFTLRRIVALNFLVCLAMSLALFLHLTLVFPKPKPAVRDTPLELLIYFPVPVMAIFYLVLRLFQPEADLLLNQALHYAFGLLVSMCVGLALAALIHSFWMAAAEDRFRLGVAVLGSLVGLVPIVLKVAFDCFWPEVMLPVRNYYALLLILATISLAWAILGVRTHERHNGLRQAA
jgi:hypothetical protein